MAQISFVLVFSLLVAVPLLSVLGQDDFQSLVDKAASQGVSQDTLDEAQKALGDAKDSSTSWGDWIQDRAGEANIGGNAPTGSTEDSAADAQEDDFEGEGEMGDSPAEAPELLSTEAPEGSAAQAPAESPSNAPQAQAPDVVAATPQAQAPGVAEAPAAATPQAL